MPDGRWADGPPPEMGSRAGDWSSGCLSQAKFSEIVASTSCTALTLNFWRRRRVVYRDGSGTTWNNLGFGSFMEKCFFVVEQDFSSFFAKFFSIPLFDDFSKHCETFKNHPICQKFGKKTKNFHLTHFRLISGILKSNNPISGTRSNTSRT